MLLVTGGAGYIGSVFVQHYLNKRNEDVLIVDNFCEGHREALVSSSRIRIIEGDVGDYAAMKRIFAKHDVSAVVHFAGSCYVAESQTNPAKYFDNNVVASLNLFKVMEETDVRKLVFSSSCATYGIPEYCPLDEKHRQKPSNVYGLTKLMIEQALDAYKQRLGWLFIALRYFNAAGADNEVQIGESHNPETHIIPLALQVALGKQDCFYINGDDYDTSDGTCIRDYVDVRDLAEAHFLALKLLDTHDACEAINLGTAHGASVKEIIAICEQITGKKIPTQVSVRRVGDPSKLVAVNDKAQQVLGWKPRYDLSQTISSAWQWEINRRF